MKLNEFLKSFEESQKDIVLKFRHAISSIYNENLTNQNLVNDMIDLLKEWSKTQLYKDGRELLNEEINLLSQRFDYDTQFGIGIEFKGKKVFPPTIGRYIANLVYQYKLLQLRIKNLESEKLVEHDRALNYQNKIVELHNQCPKEIKDIIENLNPELFGEELFRE